MQVPKRRRVKENIVPVDVRNVQNLSGRYVRCENFYGGTLSLQVADTARGNLVKLLMGVTAMTPEIRQALDAMGNMWSASTWQARARLWERLTAFCHWKQIEITPIHAVTFIASLPIKIQGKLSYARRLASLLNLAGKGTNPLRFYIKSLMAEGATEPHRQMAPLTPELLKTIVEPPSSQRKTYVAALLEGGKAGGPRQRCSHATDSTKCLRQES